MANSRPVSSIDLPILHADWAVGAPVFERVAIGGSQLGRERRAGLKSAYRREATASAGHRAHTV